MKMNLLVALSLGVTLSANAQNNTLNTAQSKFAMDLLHQIDAEQAHKNWFFSPFSVHDALSMLYAGTDPKLGTKNYNEIAKVLGFEQQTIEAASKLYQAQLKDIQAIKEVKLNIANSLWALENFPVAKEYKKALADYFSSEYKTFKTQTQEDLDKALRAINGWISNKTEGMIPSALDKVSPDAFAYLINTIYFKGNWATPFDSAYTRKEDFTNWDKSKNKVEMMRHPKQHTQLLQNDDFQAIRLPYKGNEMALYIFLPKNLDKWVKNLDAQSLEKYIANVQNSGTKTVDVKLPKFKFRYKTLLNDPLKAMGMKTAFGFAPDNFPRMSGGVDPNVLFKVSRVLHEAVVEINETGTEAAAVTIIETEVTTTSVQINKPRIEQFYVNQPFFYVIQHEKTNTTLFAGKMETME